MLTRKVTFIRILLITAMHYIEVLHMCVLIIIRTRARIRIRII